MVSLANSHLLHRLHFICRDRWHILPLMPFTLFKASMSVTLSRWGRNMSEWETGWENQRKARKTPAWKLLYEEKRHFFSLVLSLRSAGLIWCLLVFLQPDFSLLNYVLPLAHVTLPWNFSSFAKSFLRREGQSYNFQDAVELFRQLNKGAFSCILCSNNF